MRIGSPVIGMAAAVLCTSAMGQSYCKLGSEEWIAGCEASCTASWEGSDCPRSCSSTPPAGYVIVNHRAKILSVNNGGHDVSRMAADQEFDYSRQVQQAYSHAIDFAGNAGNKAAEGRLKEEARNAIAEAERFDTSHQMVRLNVNASKHSSQFDRKRGWSKAQVEMLVRCVVPPNLEQQLLQKHALR